MTAQRNRVRAQAGAEADDRQSGTRLRKAARISETPTLPSMQSVQPPGRALLREAHAKVFEIKSELDDLVLLLDRLGRDGLD